MNAQLPKQSCYRIGCFSIECSSLDPMGLSFGKVCPAPAHFPAGARTVTNATAKICPSSLVRFAPPTGKVETAATSLPFYVVAREAGEVMAGFSLDCFGFHDRHPSQPYLAVRCRRSFNASIERISGSEGRTGRKFVLKPALLTGDASGLNAIGGAEFANGFGKIVADSAFRKVEFRGDFSRGTAFASTPQYLAFAFA